MLGRALSTMVIAGTVNVCCLQAVHGQSDFPTKPVRMLVPFAAGGTFDLVARVTAQKLSEMWGQQVLVENRAGGGTIIATETVAKASPDGYTLLLSPNGLAANPALHSKLPYDAQKDLAPVALLASQPMALGANPLFAATSIKDLIALAKSKPGALSYGTAGAGSGGHLAGEIFKAAAGIDLIHVSYKGGNLAMIDVMANQIPLVMTGLPNLLPQMRVGKIKILAITEGTRSPVAPNIPTIGESVPGYSFRNWFGILAPARVPRPTLDLMNRDINRALEASDVKERLTEQGFVVIGGTQQEFGNLIRDDTRKFAEVIDRSGMKLD